MEISLAPMMKITTPHFRRLVRKISANAVLFTEMIVAATVVHVTEEKVREMLGDPEPRTVVQIGGADPQMIAEAVERLQKMGWKEFNLNCGCPSKKVQCGRFGAVLMLEKETVADIVNEVFRRTGIILSLKIRTGVDECDSYAFFKEFVEYMSGQSPCFKFYVHARKCWLSGLSPQQNRNVPPLNHEYVHSIKTEHPNLFFSLNGGIGSNGLEKIGGLDGLMIGRHAWSDVRVFMEYEDIKPDMKKTIKKYLEEASGSRQSVLQPLMNYRKGRQHARTYRRIVEEAMHSEMPYKEIYERLEPFID